MQRRSCMRTARCKLCLADIPWEYDHSFEIVAMEKEDSIEVHGAHDPRRQRQQHPSSNWPDSGAVASLFFILFVLNAAAFIIWLILRDTFSCDLCHRAIWIIVSLSTAGFCGLVNFCLAFVGRRKFKSGILNFCCLLTGSFWCGVLLETIRYARWSWEWQG